MKHFKFDTLLADSRALVTVTCEIDIDADYVGFTDVVYEGNSVFDVLSDNQWTELDWDALKAYKAELIEQETIDYDLRSA
jgi:hypothetical protein